MKKLPGITGKIKIMTPQEFVSQNTKNIKESLGDFKASDIVYRVIKKLISDGLTEVSPDVIIARVSAELGEPFMLKDLITVNNNSKKLQTVIDSINPTKIKFSKKMLTAKNEDPNKEKENKRNTVLSMASRAANRPKLGEGYNKIQKLYLDAAKDVLENNINRSEMIKKIAVNENFRKSLWAMNVNFDLKTADWAAKTARLLEGEVDTVGKDIKPDTEGNKKLYVRKKGKTQWSPATKHPTQGEAEDAGKRFIKQNPEYEYKIFESYHNKKHINDVLNSIKSNTLTGARLYQVIYDAVRKKFRGNESDPKKKEFFQTLASDCMEEYLRRNKQKTNESYDDYDDDEEEDDNNNQGFFVVISNEENGVFIGMVSKQDNRWYEQKISGKPPLNWGGPKYMSYLTPRDIMSWLHKDFDRHYDVKGPFEDEESARDYASRFLGEGILEDRESDENRKKLVRMSDAIDYMITKLNAAKNYQAAGRGQEAQRVIGDAMSEFADTFERKISQEKYEDFIVPLNSALDMLANPTWDSQVVDQTIDISINLLDEMNDEIWREINQENDEEGGISIGDLTEGHTTELYPKKWETLVIPNFDFDVYYAFFNDTILIAADDIQLYEDEVGTFYFSFAADLQSGKMIEHKLSWDKNPPLEIGMVDPYALNDVVEEVLSEVRRLYGSTAKEFRDEQEGGFGVGDLNENISYDQFQEIVRALNDAETAIRDGNATLAANCLGEANELQQRTFNSDDLHEQLEYLADQLYSVGPDWDQQQALNEIGDMKQILLILAVKRSDDDEEGGFGVGDLTEGTEQKFRVTYDIYGSNREKPLYTDTKTVRASNEQEAIDILRKLVGGRNYRAEKIGVSEGRFNPDGSPKGPPKTTVKFGKEQDRKTALHHFKQGMAKDDLSKFKDDKKKGVAEGLLNEIYKMPPTKNSSQGLADWAYNDAVKKNAEIIFQDSNTVVFQVGADMIRYIILSEGQPILYLGLTKFLDGWKSGVVAAETEARGQGLATKIYLQASDLLKQPIYSDTTQTDASRLGIWNKLIQMVPSRVVGFDQKTNNDLPLTMTKDGPVVNQNQPLYIDRNKKDSEKPVTQQQRYRTRILKLLPNKQGVAESQEVDMTGKKCTACKKGTYKETSIHDDMDGVLHCTNCNKEVTRWQHPKKKDHNTTNKEQGVAEGIIKESGETYTWTAHYKDGSTKKLNIVTDEVDAALSVFKKHHPGNIVKVTTDWKPVDTSSYFKSGSWGGAIPDHRPTEPFGTPPDNPWKY